MRERVRNILVGLCTIGALAGGASLLFFFGEIEPFFTRRWPLQVAFNDAGGLRKGSLVTLNGVPVGAIERVEIWQDADRPVLITAAIDDGVEFPIQACRRSKRRCSVRARDSSSPRSYR